MLVDGEKLKQKMRIGIFKLVHFDADERRGWYFDHVAFDNLVDSCPAPSKIFRRDVATPGVCDSTRYFESLEELTDYGHGDMADFGRWVLDQEQESWTDKDFGLEEEK